MNPMESPSSQSDPVELTRVDHFQGGGTMVQMSLVKEIVDKYTEPFFDPKENYRIMSSPYQDPLVR